MALAYKMLVVVGPLQLFVSGGQPWVVEGSRVYFVVQLEEEQLFGLCFHFGRTILFVSEKRGNNIFKVGTYKID